MYWRGGAIPIVRCSAPPFFSREDWELGGSEEKYWNFLTPNHACVSRDEFGVVLCGQKEHSKWTAYSASTESCQII